MCSTRVWLLVYSIVNAGDCLAGGWWENDIKVKINDRLSERSAAQSRRYPPMPRAIAQWLWLERAAAISAEKWKKHAHKLPQNSPERLTANRNERSLLALITVLSTSSAQFARIPPLYGNIASFAIDWISINATLLLKATPCKLCLPTIVAPWESELETADTKRQDATERIAWISIQDLRQTIAHSLPSLLFAQIKYIGFQQKQEFLQPYKWHVPPVFCKNGKVWEPLDSFVISLQASPELSKTLTFSNAAPYDLLAFERSVRNSPHRYDTCCPIL